MAVCEWCGEAHAVKRICRARPGFTRRRFFGLFGAGVAGLALAPTAAPFTREQWQAAYEACAKGGSPGLLLDEINHLTCERVLPGIVDNVFQTRPVFYRVLGETPLHSRGPVYTAGS